MEASVGAVEHIISYSFTDKTLLEEALTHSSYTDFRSYQRLEFVGDAALGLAFTNYVFLAYPQLDPGQLSLLRASNISTEKLARVAVRHRLYRYLRHKSAAIDDKVLVNFWSYYLDSVVKAQTFMTTAAAATVNSAYDASSIYKFTDLKTHSVLSLCVCVCVFGLIVCATATAYTAAVFIDLGFYTRLSFGAGTNLFWHISTTICPYAFSFFSVFLDGHIVIRVSWKARNRILLSCCSFLR